MPQTLRPIEYSVQLHAPQTQTFEVVMLVRDIATASIEVALPVWRTGRYAILNPAGTLSRVRAQRTSGASLPMTKVDKATWKIETEGCTEIEVRYSVYANSLGDRTRHVDDTHAFLSGATMFLYLPDRRQDSLLVRLEAPPHWTVACSLDSDGDPRTLLAPSYDVLIDSPIEIGVHDTLHFAVDGIPHEIVIWGAPLYDGERLTRDFSAIVRNLAGMFGTLPYERYIFMVHVSLGIGGGTEHLNSTIIQVPPRTFEDDSAYKRLILTAAHELFHVWNVKRLRPSALSTTDFSRENYTDLLWFCEGTTAYYDALVLARTGLTTVGEYLHDLGELIQLVRRRPGSQIQSVAESSFDAWIKFNLPTADDMNTTVSFYDSGALVSFLLDLMLRSRTDNRASMDTLMVEMVNRFPASGPGFTTGDLIEVASRLADSGLDYFFAKFIYSTEPFPLEDYVGAVGLELTLYPEGIRAYSGILAHDQGVQTIVRYVLSDGPAYLAGVLAGDELIAVNGRRYTAVEMSSHVDSHMKPGDGIRMEVLRRGRQRTIEFELGSAPGGRWCLSRVAAPSDSQRAAFTNWIQQPWAQS